MRTYERCYTGCPAKHEGFMKSCLQYVLNKKLTLKSCTQWMGPIITINCKKFDTGAIKHETFYTVCSNKHETFYTVCSTKHVVSN